MLLYNRGNAFEAESVIVCVSLCCHRESVAELRLLMADILNGDDQEAFIPADIQKNLSQNIRTRYCIIAVIVWQYEGILPASGKGRFT